MERALRSGNIYPLGSDAQGDVHRDCGTSKMGLQVNTKLHKLLAQSDKFLRSSPDKAKMKTSRKINLFCIFLHREIDDVDIFPGGMAERPVYGGLVGPTFACIIAQQFSSLRKGRFINILFHNSVLLLALLEIFKKQIFLIILVKYL